MANRAHPSYDGPPITPEEARWARNLRELPLTGQGISQGAAWSNTIPRGMALQIFIVPTSTKLSGTITALRGSTASLGFALNPTGQAYLRSADGWTQASASDTTTVAFLVVDLGDRPSEIVTGPPQPPVIGPVAELEFEAFQISAAALGAVIVAVAGTTVIPIGSLVRFVLGFGGNLTTVADDSSFVELRTHATSALLAQCPAGGTTAGTMRMPVLEKIDLVYQNADSVVHWVTGSWIATSGE